MFLLQKLVLLYLMGSIIIRLFRLLFPLILKFSYQGIELLAPYIKIEVQLKLICFELFFQCFS